LKTAQEHDIEGWVIQIPKNGTSWKKINFIVAKNAFYVKYDYTDLNIHQNNQSQSLYYRLKIKDLDGSFELSKIEKVLFKEKNSTVAVFPNPASDVLNLKWTQPINEEVTLSLIDISGKIILNKKVFINDTYILELSNTLAQGDYILKLSSENVGEISSQVVTILK
jgi:hypothetical protein